MDTFNGLLKCLVNNILLVFLCTVKNVKKKKKKFLFLHFMATLTVCLGLEFCIEFTFQLELFVNPSYKKKH